MNFLITKCSDIANGKIYFKSEDLSFEFSPENTETLTVKKNDQLVLGLRPEHIELTESGGITGTIFSTLPSGMETIVKIKIHNTTLTSVAFGDVDYDINSTVSVNFKANKYLLFDETSGKNIAMGKVRIMQ